MAKRKTEHDRLLDAAQKAIEDLFSDTSVSAAQTRSDLNDLRTDIDIKIECIDSDLKWSAQ